MLAMSLEMKKMETDTGLISLSLWLYCFYGDATFDNISVIWRSVLLVDVWEKTTNLSQVTSHWHTLSHNVISNWLFLQ